MATSIYEIGQHGNRARKAHSITSSSTSCVDPTPTAYPMLPQRSSPISYLPVELLSRIFVFGFFEGRNARRSSRPNFEVLASHVCKRWRTVATQETRRLWTGVYLSDLTHLDRANVYIKRSGCMLLDISIDTESEQDHIPGRTLFRDECQAAFHLVVPHISRWRSFVVKARDQQCKNITRSQLSSCGPAPALTYLQLWHVESFTTENFWASSVRPPIIVFDGQLPSLTGLSLVGVNLPWAPSHSPFIRNLKSLELALHPENMRPTYDEWEGMLRRCPTLEKLSLHYSGPRCGVRWPEEPIHLLSLTELSVADLDPDHLCSVVQRLVVKKIKRLRLELPDQDYTPFLHLICRPAVQVFAQVELLRIDSLECSMESWRRFLMSTPMVSTLEIDFTRLPVGFCEALLYTEEQKKDEESNTKMAIVFPRLSTLRVTGVTGQFLSRFDRFRKSFGATVDNYLVAESCRDRAMRLLFAEGKIVYFEDEDEDGDSASESEAEEDAGVSEEHEPSGDSDGNETNNDVFAGTAQSGPQWASGP